MLSIYHQPYLLMILHVRFDIDISNLTSFCTFYNLKNRPKVVSIKQSFSLVTLLDYLKLSLAKRTVHLTLDKAVPSAGEETGSRAPMSKIINKILGTGNRLTTRVISITTYKATTLVENTFQLRPDEQARITMKSFIEYSPDSDFPIENLPYGVFTSPKNVSTILSYDFSQYLINDYSIRYYILCSTF